MSLYKMLLQYKTFSDNTTSKKQKKLKKENSVVSNIELFIWNNSAYGCFQINSDYTYKKRKKERLM